MSAGQKLPDDDPRVIAWTAYKATEDFDNTRRWAMEPLHVEGSLWAAFLAGIEANRTLPVTADELRRRGTDLELEARAIDVVLRCGWPRPRDVIGIKPCIPVPVSELRHVIDNLATNGASVLEDVLKWLRHQLRTQEYIHGLYVRAVPIPPELIEPAPTVEEAEPG